MDLTIDVHHEDSAYWAQVRELPGCLASGRTLVELTEALGEALGQYLDAPALRLSAGISGLGVQRVELTAPDHKGPGAHSDDTH
jgi:predicted RNase H-like HicB family nuclease